MQAIWISNSRYSVACMLKMCSQFVFMIGAIAYSGSYFGVGVGHVLFDRLRCSGTESSVVDCQHSAVLQPYYRCGHNRDFGVECPGTYT